MRSSVQRLHTECLQLHELEAAKMMEQEAQKRKNKKDEDTHAKPTQTARAAINSRDKKYLRPKMHTQESSCLDITFSTKDS